MYNTSDAFKEAVQANTRELHTKVTMLAIGQTYELEAADLEANSLTVTSSNMSKGFMLGGVIADSLSLALNNRDGRWNDVLLDGVTLIPYCGFKLANESIEYVPMGVFIVDDPGRPYASVQLKATDRLILLDEPFGNVTVTYPVTIRVLTQAIAQTCNLTVTPATLALPIMDYVVKKPVTDNKMTCRDIVSEIALMAGGWARMTRTGVLEIVPVTKPTVATAYDMPFGSRKSFKQSADALTITGMTYGDLQWGTLDYPLEIKKLALLADGDAETILGSVWSKINGFTWTPCIADYFGNPALDAGDIVLHTIRDNVQVLSMITKHTYKHGGNCQMIAEGKSRSVNRYKSQNERRLANIAADITEDFDGKLTGYQQSTAMLADMLGLMVGVHRTVETLEDGSEIYYYHDAPTLAESMEIWKFNGQVLAWSDDGGQTWPSGVTVDSKLIIRQIEAVGINAEWIKLTSTTTLPDKIAEIEDNIENIELTPGASAYEVAVAAGFQGTEAEWLASLVGETGTGISSVVVEYAIGGTTAPTSGWSTTPPTTWGDTQYLWTRNKITYTDSTVAYAGTNRLNDVEAERALQKAKEYADQIQVGGRNLALKTQENYTAWRAEVQNQGAYVKSRDGDAVVWTKTDTSPGSWAILEYRNINLEKIEPNTEYVVGVDMYTEMPDTNNFRMRFTKSNALGNLLTVYSVRPKENIEPQKWKRYHFFFQTCDEGSFVVSDQVLGFLGLNHTSGNLYKFKNVHFERGTRATDWTPAPEDVQQQITTNATNITNQGVQISQITTTVNGHGEQIGTVETQVTELGAGHIALTEDVYDLGREISALQTGGGNLILNSNLGTGTEPSGAYWGIGMTWESAKKRGLTWGALKTAGKTWQNAKDGEI